MNIAARLIVQLYTLADSYVLFVNEYVPKISAVSKDQSALSETRLIAFYCIFFWPKIHPKGKFG